MVDRFVVLEQLESHPNSTIHLTEYKARTLVLKEEALSRVQQLFCGTPCKKDGGEKPNHFPTNGKGEELQRPGRDMEWPGVVRGLRFCVI